MALADKHQPYREFVEPGQLDGQFASAIFMRLAAGPPRLSQLGGPAGARFAIDVAGPQNYFYPIGLIQNFNHSANTNIMRVFEIGSTRSVFIPGRTVGQISLTRVLYHGPSLLRVIYAYYQDLLKPTLVPWVQANLGAITNPNKHNVIIPPGYENLYLNLASDLFYQPVGLLWVMRDVNEETLGATYFEACYIPNHSTSTDAQGTVIMENAMIQYERMVPVKVTAIALKTP